MPLARIERLQRPTRPLAPMVARALCTVSVINALCNYQPYPITLTRGEKHDEDRN